MVLYTTPVVVWANMSALNSIRCHHGLITGIPFFFFLSVASVVMPIRNLGSVGGFFLERLNVSQLVSEM